MRTWQARCPEVSHDIQSSHDPLSSDIFRAQPLTADIARRFLLRYLTARYYSAPRCIAGIADTYQPSTSISPPGTDIESENRLIQQCRGPRDQPSTNGRAEARYEGLSTTGRRPCGHSSTALHQAGARRLVLGRRGLCQATAAQRGVWLMGFARVAWQLLHFGTMPCLPE